VLQPYLVVKGYTQNMSKKLDDINQPKYRRKVLFVGAVPPPTTGANIACELLLQSEFGQFFQVVFIDSRFVADVSDIGVFRIRKVLLAVKYFTQFVFELLVNSPDVVIQHYASGGWATLKDSFFAIVASRLFGKKVIFWLHGNGILGFEERSWVSRQIISAGLKSATHCVVFCENHKSRFICWVAPEKMHIIPYGIKEIVSERKGIKPPSKDGVLKVLYFANLVREKGWLVAIDAASEILKSRKDIRFTFHGAWWPPEDEGFAHELVQKRGVQDYIELHGLTRGEEKRKAFAEADIFVFPTFFPVESFGIVNIEAMEAGLPIITTSRACIPEYVVDGINGFLIPEQDAQALAERIVFLADHPEIRRKMGLNNRQKYLEKFAVERFAKEWIQFVNQVIETGP
jgi:glycosyltransferase involved in cell wall biosynthesis